MKKNINIDNNIQDKKIEFLNKFNYVDIYKKYIIDLKSCFIGSTVVNLFDEHDNLLWSCSDDIYRCELKDF